jgi:tetratricopeptide (TPR) repeat protein
MRKLIMLSFFSFLTACSSAQDCKDGLNLLPMYGNIPKCEQQIISDKAFIAEADAKFKDRKTAALPYLDLGWSYFYKNDLETSMKRFNQAWLLDSLNADVYWGFGNLLGRNNEVEASIPYFEKSIKIKPDNAKVYESLATSYGQLFASTQKSATLNKAIESLKKANSLDRNNPRILSQLTAAYAYFMKKDSANKYLKLTDKIDPKAINPEVRSLLQQKIAK